MICFKISIGLRIYSPNIFI